MPRHEPSLLGECHRAVFALKLNSTASTQPARSVGTVVWQWVTRAELDAGTRTHRLTTDERAELVRAVPRPRCSGWLTEVITEIHARS